MASLLDIAKELFKNCRSTTQEESKMISDYLRKKSKTIRIKINKDKSNKD